MPNRQEWSRRWHGSIRHGGGGSTYGEGYDGGRVGYSRFGEFACRIGDQGEMTATFPDVGVMCGYDDEERLIFICVDVACFLGNLGEESLDKMADKGENILDLSRDLEAKDQVLFLTVFPAISRLAVETRDDVGLVSEDVITNIDLAKGFDGLIRYCGSEIAYHTRKLGDEMLVSIGEQDETRRTLVPVSVSNTVDYMTELETGTPKRYWKLADKIILNRK
ncbi:hypothetical protein A3K29_04985 [Candidatus Collierbacteria bacterium RIFOXYB2_FULL_46_14]|uniref:Uncharacterized protein n=1 Tax=Candidatus Collierbacteria bacterium GW2011_GWA2_46_26 TaxID=1618381 RepID=A0A0G1PK32_9BACT|nr:MAG: hypothetical protein UX47_C0006G0038 [Candidatus Collierbacteria bacterium GW2011_GWA2_46_26]OGD73451.1 MAG: hypothetical protein A3K29_04985 [Candidatus Collierbacteria bacterium RIFOXYB2_FULL_46_14]OGD76493.1 MAG: hypothetical protein A3K43_04985 [Candidatus Collierbacteria bacterium RIFOXYA2_FULL_46_20]OGD77829.1 MAG: hypothetical protein A3K39_04985 [Candidatus Collierbacteria bacterium RIFOXYC2_FULL_43_15]OGD81120.1 MAG: hypothetical protein A2320_05485 [Pseudomonadales bacterium G